MNLLLQLLGLGAYSACEKHCDNKRAKIYYNDPINIKLAQQMKKTEEEAHKNIVEIMSKSGIIINPKTGIDQNGKKWWIKNYVLENWRKYI